MKKLQRVAVMAFGLCIACGTVPCLLTGEAARRLPSRMA